MPISEEPYYTYSFGSMGQTLKTASQTSFFQWFHMRETERRAEEPGEAVRFRPSGEKFHDLCYLDTLLAGSGEMVGMELVVQRAFIDGRDRPFAQDLVKSFLREALPEACRDVLQDFMQEIQLPGRNGATPGYLVFNGRQNSWKTQTGWSRLLLANLDVSEVPSLVVRVAPNPQAPNARLIANEGDSAWCEQWRFWPWLRFMP